MSGFQATSYFYWIEDYLLFVYYVAQFNLLSNFGDIQTETNTQKVFFWQI